MGTHTVATGPIQPQPWAPRASNLLFVGGSQAFAVVTNCLSSFPASAAKVESSETDFFDNLTIQNHQISL